MKYLVTTGARDKIDRVHSITCKRAQAQGGKERNLSDPGGRTPASCCKPKFGTSAITKPEHRPTAQPKKATGVSKATPAKKAPNDLDGSSRPGRRTKKASPVKAAAKKAPAKKASAPKKSAPKKATPRKVAAKKASAPQVPDVANARQALAAGADPHPGRRADLAEQEGKAKRLARGAGEPTPATPNADFVAKEYADGIDAAARKGLVKEYEAALRGEAGAKRGRPAPSVQFHHNGKPQPASQNRLSSLAYGFTRDVGRERPRMPATELRDLIVKECKVSDPENEAWEITLPNGHVLKATKVEA